jgi:hypothetical protein
MDDELLKLERELKSLRPVEPSIGLRSKLASPNPRHETSANQRRWGWLVFPAAAALALAAFVATKPHRDASIVEPAASFKPVAAENLLLASHDEGYVTLTDGSPAHRTRQMYLDRITWKNPRTNASLTWSVPREEVRVVPVTFQ